MSAVLLERFDLSPNPIEQVVGDFVAQGKCTTGVLGVFSGREVLAGLFLDAARFLADVAVQSAHLSAVHAYLVQGRWVGNGRQAVEKFFDGVCRLQDSFEVFRAD